MLHPTIIIGAGLSGLSAAAVMRKGGREVLVVEKSRGFGGRAATRRWDNLPLDHGAQFFTARSGDFRGQVEEWLRKGVCHEWTRGFHQLRNGKLAPSPDEKHARYACLEGMSALGRDLVAIHGLDVRREARVAAIARTNAVWELACEDGRVFRSYALAVTCPPPQGAALLRDAAPEASDLLASIAMHPCVAVVARYPRFDLPWNGIQSDDPMISWLGNDTSKRPDVHGQHTVLVMHASPIFSRENADSSDDALTRTILARASDLSQVDLLSPQASFVHRWRYAMPADPPQGLPARLFCGSSPLVLAGECFAGGKIEGAWLSGKSAGEMLLRV